jgi:hypothetical protein
VAAASTDAAANGLDPNTELCGNGSQADPASLVGGADGRTPAGWIAGRPIGLPLLVLGPRLRHTGQHALADNRAVKLGERAKHLKHRLTCRRGGIEALLMQVEIDIERVQFG